MKNNKDKKSIARFNSIEEQPIHRIQWVHRDSLVANNWNPNKQAPAETHLLEISILEDGWTQPIVALNKGEDEPMVIIDGFHRHYVSGRPSVFAMTNGYVPVVVLVPEDINHEQMSTVRHNRARGTHGVLPMARIVQEMLDRGLKPEEIGNRLQMERDEVERLALRVGVPLSNDIQKAQFGKAWIPE